MTRCLKTSDRTDGPESGSCGEGCSVPCAAGCSVPTAVIGDTAPRGFLGGSAIRGALRRLVWGGSFRPKSDTELHGWVSKSDIAFYSFSVKMPCGGKAAVRVTT